MATLPETAAWPTGVYQIEEADPVLGGPPNPATGDGLVNIPAQQLANRTVFLRALIDAAGLGSATGVLVTNLNAIDKTGLYYCAGTATGVPVSDEHTVLHIQAGTPDATQFAIGTGADRIWFRRRLASSWQTWREIRNSGATVPIGEGGTGATTAGAALTNLGAVPSTRTITAGSGISGGGDLSANRTIAVDSTVVRTTRQINAGQGIRNTGGPSLASDMTLSIDAGDGITVGITSVGVDSTVVRTTRSIVAGDGLVGGGTLAGTVTVDMGTPSAITSTSGNDVTASSHTHALASSTVRALIAEGDVGQVGSYAYLRRATANNAILKGNDYAGSALRYAGTIDSDGDYKAQLELADNTAPAGTWRAMGSVGSITTQYSATLFLRIA